MKRPNILILYTDQQRWDALGANGNRDIRTPHLDALAAQGLNYKHHYVQCPVSMPSRASLMTGQYCSTLGVTDNGIPVPADAITLPRLLRPYGYTSAQIGKLHFQPHANRDHREPYPGYGFDHLEISDEPGCYEDAYRAWVRRNAPDQLDLISVGLPPAARVWQETMGIRDGIVHPAERFPKRALAFRGRSGATHSAFVAEQTLAYIRRRRDGPFLCVVGFYSPHSPWVAPQEFLDLYNPSALALPAFPPEVDAQRSDSHFPDSELRSARHGYYAMVSEVDHHVGRILKCLDELGLAEDTVVVFTSDHGEWLGEHLRYGKGYPGHDCVTRVPLIIRWLGGLGSPGRTINQIVEAVDVVPTFLEWASIQVPGHLQGRRLPETDDERAGGRTCALSEMTGWKTIRTKNFRYVLCADGREELYDLAKDPGGYKDVAGEAAYASALSEARGELARRLIALERPLPRTWPY